jgi:cytochrome c-type biogenesis protein CcmH/NrfF
MRNKVRLRNKLALVALLSCVLLTGSVPMQNPRVRSVGELLTCQCGCNYSVASCNMQSCHFADPMRVRLLQMVEAGVSDDQILATLEKEYGKIILRKPPAEGFYLISWIMPFAGLGGGLAFVWFILQRYKAKPAITAVAGTSPGSGAEPDSPELARYRERIEKDLSDMDSGRK